MQARQQHARRCRPAGATMRHVRPRTAQNKPDHAMTSPMPQHARPPSKIPFLFLLFLSPFSPLSSLYRLSVMEYRRQVIPIEQPDRRTDPATNRPFSPREAFTENRNLMRANAGQAQLKLFQNSQRGLSRLKRRKGIKTTAVQE
jgi:hypothetical protein